MPLYLLQLEQGFHTLPEIKHTGKIPCRLLASQIAQFYQLLLILSQLPHHPSCHMQVSNWGTDSPLYQRQNILLNVQAGSLSDKFLQPLTILSSPQTNYQFYVFLISIPQLLPGAQTSLSTRDRTDWEKPRQGRLEDQETKQQNELLTKKNLDL